MVPGACGIGLVAAQRPLLRQLPQAPFAKPCRPFTRQLVVSAGQKAPRGPKQKKLLKQKLADIGEELESKLAELEGLYAARARTIAVEGGADHDQQLGPQLHQDADQLNDLAQTALQLAHQAEGIQQSAADLWTDLRAFADRLGALSTSDPTQEVASPLPAVTKVESSSGHDAPASEVSTSVPPVGQPSPWLPQQDAKDTHSSNLGVTTQSSNPTQNQPGAPPSQGPAYPTSIAEVFGRSADEEPQLLPFAAQVQAAMQAVNDVDVLNTDVDYIAEGERLRQMHSAQASGDTVDLSSIPQNGSATPPEELVEEQPGDSEYFAAVRAAMASLKEQRESPPAGLKPAAPPADTPAAIEQTPQAAGNGPPPTLAPGDDDIFWVNQLQAALLEGGCYPGEEELELWLFGDSTQSALLTFQAMNGLPETGVADRDTWIKLLGPELQPVIVSPSDEAEQGAEPADIAAPETPRQESAPPSSPWDNLFDSSKSIGSSGGSQAGSRDTVPEAAASQASGPKSSAPKAWPVVRLDDGGRAVHQLQCALEGAGYFCGDDEMLWWQFGGNTEASLRTFQACNGLPETGVSDTATWLALLGKDAQPAGLLDLHAKDPVYDDDMEGHNHDGAVWLLGEQRWSRPTGPGRV